MISPSFQRCSQRTAKTLTATVQRNPRHFLLHLRCLQLKHSAYSTSVPSSQHSRGVRIVEVGPRDGLQNIRKSIPTATKVELIKRLTQTGLLDIEATSFVSPEWVPQLADGAAVLNQILPLTQQEQGEIRFPVLTPNEKGLENAKKAGAKDIVVFVSVTEAFSKKNQNCTVDEALDRAKLVTEKAISQGIAVRG